MTSDPTLDPIIPSDINTSPLNEELMPPENWENTINENNTIIDLQDQLARAHADYANLVRRSRDESAHIGQWSEERTILKFLPVLDNLERALDHIPSELIDNPWIAGNKSIVRSMQKTLSDLEVIPMVSIGQEVNPDFHDVISQIPYVDTTIQNEIEKWYMRRDKALRHAKVIVWDGEKMAA